MEEFGFRSRSPSYATILKRMKMYKASEDCPKNDAWDCKANAKCAWQRGTATRSGYCRTRPTRRYSVASVPASAPASLPASAFRSKRRSSKKASKKASKRRSSKKASKKASKRRSSKKSAKKSKRSSRH